MATATAREARLPLAEAPGEGERRVVELGGRSVGVFRLDGDYFALADRCPHRGAPLCSEQRRRERCRARVGDACSPATR